MVSFKVSPTIFSPIKTIVRALAKARDSDEIQVSAGYYKESLNITQSVTIMGRNVEETIIEGTIVIPKNTTVTFEHISFVPTVQMYIEGTAIFTNCQFDGSHTSALISLNNGKLTLSNCKLSHAKHVAVALFNNSFATIIHSVFTNNGKAQLLVEKSTVTLINSELSNAAHAIWLKADSTCMSKKNRFHSHSGTQIILQQQGVFNDEGSTFEKGQGNGIFAKNNSQVTLTQSLFSSHALPQIWMQHSELVANDCQIINGQKSGVMAHEQATIHLNNCTIAHHKVANIQGTLASNIKMDHCWILRGAAIGIQLRDKAIATITNSTIQEHMSSQIVATSGASLSIKECVISHGSHVGISLEKDIICTIVQSTITEHGNTAITITGAELNLMDSEISNNSGNGILAINAAQIQVDSSKFSSNNMPHIAGKNNVTVTMVQCDLSNGKGLYIIDQSHLFLTECQLFESDGVQLEITDETTALLKSCTIKNGKSNGIKALRNSSITMENSMILEHDMPQIVVNDSSIVVKDCEVLDGKKNGFIIENNSEAFIMESFIAKHQYPQIWIDLESTVELTAITLTDGIDSDLYVQNKSQVQATKCIIRNIRFPFNIQAVNYSSIKLNESIIENSRGGIFYSENNSTIVHLVDEINE